MCETHIRYEVMGVEKLAWDIRRREGGGMGTEEKGKKKKRGRREGRGNRTSAPQGLLPAGPQRSELVKCKPLALAERSGQWFAFRELGTAGNMNKTDPSKMGAEECRRARAEKLVWFDLRIMLGVAGS